MYRNSKIYKIVGNVENSKQYIGSTTQFLSKRMSQHRVSKQTMVHKIFDEYGIENCKIILIEKFPCENKEELLMRERYWIETMECVNKYIPIATFEEKKQTQKEANERHRERSSRIDCECGGSYLQYGKAKHEKTLMHQEHLRK